MEDVTKKETVQKFSFNNRDYLANDEIAFFSQELYILKLENKLIGDYSSEGKYALPVEILKNLTDLKKTVTKKKTQDLYLKAEALNREFRFIVKVFSPMKNKKVAQLFLVETFTTFTQKDKEIVSLVANYLDEDDVFFEEKFKKVFNIVSDEQSGKEENELIVKALLEKLKFEERIYTNFLLQTKIKDKFYVEKLLKLLAEDVTGYEVLKKYEALLLKYQAVLNPKDKDYYRKLKQLLDELLEQERKVLSDNLNFLLVKLRGAYVKSNQPLLESLQTAVAKKVKEIEKEIKIGKGLGQLKFDYYKGVNVKKVSKQSAKKHPNVELKHKQTFKSETEKLFDDNIKDNLKETLRRAANAYVAGRYDDKSKIEHNKISAPILKEKVEAQTNSKTVRTNYQTVKKQESLSKTNENVKTDEKKKEETSLFGMLFGGE